MKPARAILLLAALLIASAVGIGAVWILRGEILQGLVRPWIEERTAEALQAEVRIERLLPVAGGVRFEGVSLRRRDGSLWAEIPAGKLELRLSGLLEGRLERVLLLRPRLFLSPGGEDEKPFRAFGRPSLMPEELDIRGGTLRLRTPDASFLLHRIDLRARGVAPVEIDLSALAGVEGEEIGAAGELQWDEGATLTIRSLRWQENTLLDSPLTIRLPSQESGSAQGAFRLERLERVQLDSAFEAFGKSLPLPSGLRFALLSPTLRLDWGEGLRLEGAFPGGTLRMNGLDLSLGPSAWRLARTGEAWRLESDFALAEGASGDLEALFEGKTVTGRLELRIPRPGELYAGLFDADPLPVAGGLRFEGRFGRSEEVLRLAGSFAGDSAGERSDYLLDLSSLSGNMEITRAEETWSAGAEILLEGRKIAEARAAGPEVSITLRPLSGRTLRRLLGPALREAVPAGVSGAAGELRLFPGNGWAGSAKIRAASFPLPRGRLEELRFFLRFHPAEGEIRFTGWSGRAHLADEGVPAGVFRAEGEGRWGGKGWAMRLDRIVAEDLSYLSGDAGFAGGRLAASGTLSGTGAGAVAVDLLGEIALREILRGAFYADLSGLEGNWSLRGAWEPGASRLSAERLELAVQGVGLLKAEGTVGSGTLRLRGGLRLAELGGAFSERILPALAEELPAAEGLSLSGSLESEFALEADGGGWHLRGSARPDGLDIRGGALQASEVSGEVPFELFSGKPPVSSRERRGRLAVGALALGPARLQGANLTVVSRANRIEFPGPVDFRLSQGSLRAAQVFFASSETGPGFGGEIDIEGIDLEALTGELGWLGMQGRLDAELERIIYADGILSSEGNIVVEAFGGTLLVSRIRMEAPFSSYPLLFGDIDFSGIDLYRLTRAFSFGAIHGVADGFIHDLRLYRFTPSRFEAVLQTREEGTRNISVRALQNLTVISQGGLSGALSEGFLRFVDFYRYRKMGIWCVLRRDTFVLRGTAREGSERYLVYGGILPPKIDILAPEHAISFREMLKRLRRIDRTDEDKGEED